MTIKKTVASDKGQVLADFDGAPLMLPPTPFMYTLDQIQSILSVGGDELKSYLFLEGRTVLMTSQHRRDYMTAINLAPPDKPASWRIEETELTRWLKRKGMVTAKARILVRATRARRPI